MKKILISVFMLLPFISADLLGTHVRQQDSFWSSAFTAGYVFKHDSQFKDVYGHGVINAITGDVCYYRWDPWGIGAKMSYWRAKGRTSFLQQRSIIQQVPITFYLRRLKTFDFGLQLYASLGAGLIWTKEKSYLSSGSLTKGIGEFELGLQYPIWRCLNVVGAFRYLFPRQRHLCERVMYGGYDLRAGIGFSF